jgi:succinyl-diaminopimelate desuccinylase
MPKIFNTKKSPELVAKDFLSVNSVSNNEKTLADIIQNTLSKNPNLKIKRISNTILVETKNINNEKNAILSACHIDTVPISKVSNNFPPKIKGQYLWGRGSVDMKSSGSMYFKIASELSENSPYSKFIFYEAEEIEHDKSGIQLALKKFPEFFKNIKYTIVGEPSNLHIGVGCKGNIKARISFKGTAVHVAYPGNENKNAIHKLLPILQILNKEKRQVPIIDGYKYPETLNAVFINGGETENVMPTGANIDIMYRYAPNKSPKVAEKYLKNLFKGYKLEIYSNTNGAMPNIKSITDFTKIAKKHSLSIIPKQGWTDVATFYQMGITAFSFGCGEPTLSHTDNEQCLIKDIKKQYKILKEVFNVL